MQYDVMAITLYHNPHCSKSRQALALLIDATGEDGIRIVRYLDTGLTGRAVRDLQAALGTRSVRDIMRTGEAVYGQAGLKSVTDEDALVAAICAHPILLQRPVAVYRGRGVIGRPPERVLKLLPGDCSLTHC